MSSSAAVEDKEAQLSVHKPLTRVALVLDLVEGPEMPLAVALAAPEGIVLASIGRLDLPCAVRSALCCDPPVLHLDVFASRSVSARSPGLSHRRRWRRRDWDMAVGDVVGSRRCSGTRRVDVSRMTVARHRVVVRPLKWRIKVSKWVHRAIQSVVEVASKPTIGGVAWVMTRAVVIGAGVRVGVC